MTFAGAIRAGGAVFEVTMGGPIDRQLRGLERRLRGMGRLGSGFESIGRQFQGLGTKALGLSAALAAPFVGAIKAASDMEETMSKFGIVFGASADDVKAFGERLGADIGRSQLQIRGFLASAQDLFVPLGFTPERAAELSKQITGLTFDLGSFNNMNDADVFRDLSAALTGSGEVMKKYGVIVSESAVKQELLNQKLDPKTATDQEKVQARLNIILRGTTAAQGDAARTAAGFANQLKALQASISDAAVEVGGALLPTVTQFVNDLNVRVVPMVREWIRANQGIVLSAAKAVPVIAAAGAAFLTLGTVVGAAGAALAGTAAAAGVAVSAISALATPIGVVSAALGAVAFTAIPEFAEAFKIGFGGIGETANTAVAGVVSAIKAGSIEDAFRLVTVAVESVWMQMILTLKESLLQLKIGALEATVGVLDPEKTAFGHEANQALQAARDRQLEFGKQRAELQGAVVREIASQEAKRTAKATEEIVRLLSTSGVSIPIVP